MISFALFCDVARFIFARRRLWFEHGMACVFCLAIFWFVLRCLVLLAGFRARSLLLLRLVVAVSGGRSAVVELVLLVLVRRDE